MNEQNNQQHDDFGGAGFEPEGVNQEKIQNNKIDEQKNSVKNKKSDEMKRNFNAVFGHGIGKISLYIALIVIICSVILGYRGLSKNTKEISHQSEVDVPNAPSPSVEISPISKQEADRRAQRAALEAQEAADEGRTYQPGFDTNIINNPEKRSSDIAQFNVFDDNSTLQEDTDITVTTGQSYDYQRQNTQSEQQAQRLQQELKQAQAERDKYVESIKEQVLKQAQSLLGESGQGGLNAQGSYSTINYYPANYNNNNDTDQNGNTAIGPLPGLNTEQNILGNPNAKLLIKTGNIMYATLDSEVNTDDGGNVLATIRGGTWDRAKIIGQVEQGPNNIRLKFSILAPQDNRPTMRINAVALREKDAKQGVAENIDYHTFGRYTSLAVASLLSGYGRAYSTQIGTTVVSPSGTVTTTTSSPENKQIIGMAVGEMGQAMSQEIRQGFNRPTTYSTPSQKGFGLFFMQDVHEQK